MPAPRRQYRKSAVDHVADALIGLEAAEAALARIDDANVSAAARGTIAKARTAVARGKHCTAETIEILLRGGTTTKARRRPAAVKDQPADPTPEPAPEPAAEAAPGRRPRTRRKG